MKNKRITIRFFTILTVIILATIACGTPNGPSSNDLKITVSVPADKLTLGDSLRSRCP